MKNHQLKRLIPKTLHYLLLVVILTALIIPVPAIAADVGGGDLITYELPKLDAGRDYYQSTFPSGLVYSSAWAGTYSFFPNGMEQVMFDDNYVVDKDGQEWGICIFSLPKGSKPPHGEQGGTKLQTMTVSDVETVMKNYSLNTLVKPWNNEILEVMSTDHKYVGAWAGAKLAQKFTSSDTARTETKTIDNPVTGEIETVTVEKELTPLQQEYITDTKDVKLAPVDLERFDPDRYWVMGQVFFTDETANCSLDGRQVADSAFTVGGAGDFTVHMANGTTGTVTGTNVTGSPITLTAGSNTITCSDAVADGNFDITIGTAANWNTVNSWSASSGGACGASVPTNADNTLFDANSFTAGSQVLTVDATANCLAMDWTGATNSPTLAGSSILNIYGDLTFINAMTMTYSSGITMVGGAQSINTNGLTLTCTVTLNAGTKQLLSGVSMPTKQMSVQQTATLTTNGNDITTGPFVLSGTTPTLTLSTSTINCTSFSNTASGIVTVTTNTATINIAGTGALAGGSADYNGADFNLNGTSHTISGAFTCATLIRNGTATNTNTVTFTSGTTVTCTDLSLIGNSRANQLLARSSTLGTAATITVTNAPTLTNVDLMDITLTNAFDASAQVDVGDCGGNTGITFPAAVAQSSTKDGSASDSTMWTSRIPLPGIDDVTCNHNMTWDMPRMGKSIIVSETSTIRAVANLSFRVYGSLTFSPGANYVSAANAFETFCGRGEYGLTLSGKILRHCTVSCPGGTLNVIGSFIETGGTTATELVAGNLNFGGDFSGYGLKSVGILTRTLNLGSGTFTLKNYTAPFTKINLESTGLTFNAGTSTIVMTNSETSAQTFAGGGLTYNNVKVEGAGAYALTITGNNTFNTFEVDAISADKSIITTGTVQTVNDFIRNDGGTNNINITGGTWTKHGRIVDGTGTFTGSPVYFDDLVETVDCTVAGTATITLPYGVTGTAESGTMTVDGSPVALVAGTNTITTSGAIGNITITTNSVDSVPIALDYLTVTNSTAQPVDVWHAGSNSTDGTGNTNWIFDDPALSVTSGACTGVTMDKDGVTGGTFNGTINTLLDGTPTITTYFEYGLTNAYGAQTANVIIYDDGAFTGTIPSLLTPGQTYHFRAVATNGNAASPFLGADSTFTFTMPTVSTSSANNINPGTFTLNGNVSNMGVSTGYYIKFQYGISPTFDRETETDSKTTTGTYSQVITDWEDHATVYFRPAVTVGSTTVYGDTLTFRASSTIENFTGYREFMTAVPVLIFSIFFFPGIFLGFINTKSMIKDRQANQRALLIDALAIVLIVVGYIGMQLCFDVISLMGIN